MAYTPTTWVSNSAPALNATNLNKLTDELKLQALAEGVSHSLPTWVNGSGAAVNDGAVWVEIDRVVKAVADALALPYTVSGWSSRELPSAAKLNKIELQLADNRDAIDAGSSLGSLVPAFVTPSSGTTYYVDKDHGSASDSNAGTSESAPWATVGKALDAAPANAIVRVKKGTTPYSIAPKTVTRGGSAGNYITIEAYDPANKPIIQASSGADALLIFSGVNAAYWRLRNLIVDAATLAPSCIKFTYTGADANAANVAAHHIEVYGVEAINSSNTAGAGFLTTGSSVHDIWWWNCISRDNGTTVTTTHGWYLDGGHDMHLMNCIARDNSGYGIHVYNSTTTQMPRDIYLYNCLFTSQQTRSGFLVQGDHTVQASLPRSIHAYNCISAFNNESSGTQYGYRFRAANVSDFTGYEANTLDNCMSYSNLNGDVDLFNAAMLVNAGFITGQNPLFVNGGSKDYHLQAGSPCIGAGLDDYTPPIDFEGNIRTLADLGPYKS